MGLGNSRNPYPFVCEVTTVYDQHRSGRVGFEKVLTDSHVITVVTVMRYEFTRRIRCH